MMALHRKSTEGHSIEVSFHPPPASPPVRDQEVPSTVVQSGPG